jgi:hypothetical protein
LHSPDGDDEISMTSSQARLLLPLLLLLTFGVVATNGVETIAAGVEELGGVVTGFSTSFELLLILSQGLPLLSDLVLDLIEAFCKKSLNEHDGLI